MVFFLHGDTLGGWWRCDDPYHIKFLQTYSPKDYLFKPEVWQQFSPVNFTPALPLSLGMDLWLFELEPAGFYWHHLFALALAVVLFYMLMVAFFSPHWALLSTGLFIVSAPTALVARELMDRHYVEGLILACMALLLFISAQKSKRNIDAWFGGIAYLLAILCKEIYAPLLIVLPFIRFSNGRKWLSLALPYLLAALIYVLGRFYMLHAPLSGYSSWKLFNAESAVSQILQLPLLVLGDNPVGFFGLICLVLLVLAALARSPRYLKEIILYSGLVLIPLLPLTIWPGLHEPGRFLFLPGLAGCVLVAWAGCTLSKISKKWALLAWMLAVPISLAVINQGQARTSHINEVMAEMEAELKFIHEDDKTKILMLRNELSTMFATIRQLHRVYKPEWQTADLDAAMQYVVLDELQLLPFDLKEHQVLTYSPQCRCLVDITPAVIAQMQKWRESLRNVPLDVFASHSGYQYSWKFGPFDTGSYSVLEKTLGKASLASQGSIRILTRLGPMVVRYDSPEGWTSYSKPFQVGPAGIEWTGSANEISSLWMEVFSENEASSERIH